MIRAYEKPLLFLSGRKLEALFLRGGTLGEGTVDQSLNMEGQRGIPVLVFSEKNDQEMTQR